MQDFVLGGTLTGSLTGFRGRAPVDPQKPEDMLHHETKTTYGEKNKSIQTDIV